MNCIYAGRKLLWFGVCITQTSLLAMLGNQCTNGEKILMLKLWNWSAISSVTYICMWLHMRRCSMIYDGPLNRSNACKEMGFGGVRIFHSPLKGTKCGSGCECGYRSCTSCTGSRSRTCVLDHPQTWSYSVAISRIRTSGESGCWADCHIVQCISLLITAVWWRNNATKPGAEDKIQRRKFAKTVLVRS
jgi:hypothetical protein